jgi:hypothetical protein
MNLAEVQGLLGKDPGKKCWDFIHKGDRWHLLMYSCSYNWLSIEIWMRLIFESQASPAWVFRVILPPYKSHLSWDPVAFTLNQQCLALRSTGCAAVWRTLPRFLCTWSSRSAQFSCFQL